MIKVTGISPGVVKKGVTMKRLWALAGLGVLASASHGAVINFDDLATTVLGGDFVPTNYAGFNWGFDWGLMNNADYNAGYGNSTVFPSLNNAVYNAYGFLSVTMSGSQPFTFKGAQVATFAENDQFSSFSSTTLTIEGYNSGNLIYTKTVNLSPTAFQWFDADYQNIDTLVFLSEDYARWWVLDDFTYETGGASAVPGPAAAVPFALGLLAMRRRRK